MLRAIIFPLLIPGCLFCNAQIKKPYATSPATTSRTIVTKRLSPAGSSYETTAIRNGFTIQVPYKLFRYSNLKRNEVKGIILLSNFDAKYSTLLIKIAQGLADAECIVAIIQHRANVTNGDFSAQADTLGKDYENVWNEIYTKYGGTKSTTVIGGVSFSGFAISYLINQPGSWLSGIKGVALIAASTNPYVKFPILNKVCVDDPEVNDAYGNFGGTALQNELNTKNPSIASLSSCETDTICSGHKADDTWTDFFIHKIKAWLQ